MLDGLRDLWTERPAVVAAAVIAPIAFVITLLVLFLAVGSGDGAQLQQEVAGVETEQDLQAADQPAAARQQSVVVSEVKTGEQSSQERSASAETQAAQPQQQPEPQSAEPGDSQPEQAEAQASAASQENQAEEQDSRPVVPQVVNGQRVVPLSEVLEEKFDEEALKHGTDGSEGGILPIDNGVVVSSRPEHQTKWELIVPSAGLKSAVVRVGRTPSGAMGSPDNPYVIGWLDSSAAPGEPGNTLLAGHRDFEDVSGNIGTGVCWELVNTEPGDQMLVRDNDQGIYYVYTVTEAVTLDPHDRDAARYLWDTEEPVITLITCTGSFNADTHQYSHRLVVVGVLAAVASPDA